MALEPITRQEQIIAGKNLEPITRMERFLKEYGGSSGGGGVSVQSDWNQTDETAADFIKNKPFGDMPTGGDTLCWDGNTDGLANADGIGWLVSDKLPTMSDLANGGVIVGTMSDGSTTSITFTASEVIDVDGDGSLIAINDVVNVFNLESIHGVAFMKNETAYISSFTIHGYTGFPVTKKMDSKYYVGSTMFYTDETYLYTDALCTTKATKADVSKAMGRGTIAVSMGWLCAWTPCNINFATYDYAVVACMDLRNEDTLQTRVFYTAEYTP